jgi:hypothetical protein
MRSLHLAEAITSELQLVGSDTSSDISQIESLLAVKRRARVSVRHSHVGERQAVEKRATLEVDVVEGQAFTEVEADAEVPILPLDEVALQIEGSSFRSTRESV